MGGLHASQLAANLRKGNEMRGKIGQTFIGKHQRVDHGLTDSLYSMKQGEVNSKDEKPKCEII